MNYIDLKDEIKSIAEIADGVPEKFRERCFELLLQHLLGSVRKKNGQDGSKLNDEDFESDGNDASTEKFERSGPIPTPSQVKVFLQKNGGGRH